MKNSSMCATPIDAQEFDDPEIDWDAFDALTAEEVREAVESDPDARIPTDDELRRARRVPNVKEIRERLNLPQAAFAKRFGFSMRTVQQWEQGRSIPNRGFRLYLHAIADSIALVDPTASASKVTELTPQKREEFVTIKRENMDWVA